MPLTWVIIVIQKKINQADNLTASSPHLRVFFEPSTHENKLDVLLMSLETDSGDLFTLRKESCQDN